MSERIGFGIYKFWRNMQKVGYVSEFGCGGVGGVREGECVVD